MHKLLLAASMLCMGTAAHAEPSFYRGAGVLLCARFNQQLNATKVKATATENYYFAWAQGYMSGLNETLEARMGRYRDLNSVSTDNQKQSLRTFCAKNPASMYREGIGALLNTMTEVHSTRAPAYPVER
jgi:hypothetical protein